MHCSDKGPTVGQKEKTLLESTKKARMWVHTKWLELALGDFYRTRYDRVDGRQAHLMMINKSRFIDFTCVLL